MSDQMPAPETDTQATDPALNGEVTPEQPTQPNVDWQDRYQNLQPEYTRATQEAAQYRQLIEGLQSDDQDTRARSAQALGIEFLDDPDTTPPGDDPFVDQGARAELQALKAEREQERQQAQEEQRIAHLESVAEKDMDSIGVPDHLKDWLVSRAIALPATEHGTLNIQGAWQEFQGIRDAEQQAWRKTKNAPFVSASGQQATQVPDLNDDKALLAWQMQKLADLDAPS